MKKFNFLLFIIVLLFGWFGIDKLYFKNWRLCLVKLFTSLIVVGIIWNLYDLVCVILNRYKVNPLKL